MLRLPKKININKSSMKEPFTDSLLFIDFLFDLSHVSQMYAACACECV